MSSDGDHTTLPRVDDGRLPARHLRTLPRVDAGVVPAPAPGATVEVRASSTSPSKEWRTLLATAVLAVGVPAGAYAWIGARTADLAAHLGDAGGVPVSLGAIDVDLTGALRLNDVALGDLFSADSIEASVSLESLLSGELRADELMVSTPRVAIEVDADGDSDLARLARRLAKARPRTTRASSSSSASGAHTARHAGVRLRRIVVSEGTLTARIAGIGELSADDVELIPDAGGIRIVTGSLRVTSHGSGLPPGVVAKSPLAGVDIGFSFARSAAELTLPELRLRRALAAGGTGAITAGGRAVSLTEVTAGRLTGSGPLELRAAVDDNGIPRPLSLTISPGSRSLIARGEHVPLAGLAALAPSELVLDDARASGRVEIHAADKVSLSIDGDIDGLLLAHSRLSATPIPVNGALRTSLTVEKDSVTLDALSLRSGAIDIGAHGWVHRAPLTGAASGQLELSLASAPCADLLASLPTELRGPLDGLVLAGTMGVDAKLTLDLAAQLGEGAALVTNLTGGCTAVSEPPAADVTTLRESEDGWVKLDKLPDYVRNAWVSAEDGRFWDHDGFDLQQIARSLEIDLRERRFARGGSTISQQLIKNAFLTHRRTFDRKIQEAILTWRLEAKLSKRQILERYLNIIELAPRVSGLPAAAKYWFDRSPEHLTVKQAAFLAAITSEPSSMSRRVRTHGGLDPVSSERVQTILRAMRRDKVISDAQYAANKGAGMDFAPSAIRDDR